MNAEECWREYFVEGKMYRCTQNEQQLFVKGVCIFLNMRYIDEFWGWYLFFIGPDGRKIRWPAPDLSSDIFWAPDMYWERCG